MKRLMTVLLSIFLSAPLVRAADPFAEPANELRPNAGAPARPDSSFEVKAGRVDDTVVNQAVDRTMGPVQANDAFKKEPAASAGLTSALGSVSTNRRETAAAGAVAAMGNADVAAAVAAAPAAQRGNVLLALAAVPRAQQSDAAKLLKNDKISGALSDRRLNASDRAAILTTLLSVPAAERGSEAPRLALNPTAARTLAAIPAGAARDEAVAIVLNVAANNPGANLAQTAAAVAKPEVRAVIAALPVEQQAALAPAMGNPQIQKAVMAIKVGGLGGVIATQALRASTLQVMSRVLDMPVPSNSSQPAMITAALRATADPAVLDVLTRVPPAQQGAAAVMLGNSQNGAAMRQALTRAPGTADQKAAFVVAMTQMAPVARDAAIRVLSAAPAVARPVVEAVATMRPADAAAAITLLGGGQSSAALRSAVAGIGGPGDAQARGNFMSFLVNTPDAKAQVKLANAGQSMKAAPFTAMITAARQATVAMGTAGMPAVIAAMPKDQQGLAMMTLGQNPPAVNSRAALAAGNAARATIVGMPGGDTVRANVVSTLMSNGALTAPNITSADAALRNAAVAGVPAASRGQVAAVLAQSPGALAAFAAVPVGGARDQAVSLLTSINMPANNVQQAVLTNALTHLGNANVVVALAGVPAADRNKAILLVGGNADQRPAVAIAGLNNAAAQPAAIRQTMNLPVNTNIRLMMR